MAKTGENKFVFVVCGSREHIDTLHFSLRYIRYFSKHEIVVVTDSRRNEIPVEHNHIIDVYTPPNFTHHEASIYLKTGLHKFLPKGNLYCYLDTDVIALNPQCDDVFKQKTGPITFAADHCTMPKFSPHAVKCDCLKKNREEIAELEKLMEKYDPGRKNMDPEMEQKKRALIKKFEVMKQDKLSYFFIALRFITTLNKFKLDEDTYYDRWKKVWHDKQGRIIITPAESMVKDIEKNSEWRWNSIKRRWYGPDGRDVYNLECPHLGDYILERFGITVSNKNFQHWNGGVFLFDDSSHNFMEAWFNKTMQIFDFPEWMTRDQGTLIATVWELGLQEQKLLNKQFNFIADYHNNKMMMDEKGNFTDDAFNTSVQPSLIHIYHNFGKKGWDVWDYVETVGKNIPANDV
jgi:hypothetical protein